MNESKSCRAILKGTVHLTLGTQPWGTEFGPGVSPLDATPKNVLSQGIAPDLG